MVAKRYVKARHEAKAAGFLVRRHMDPTLADNLPSIGYIVPGVAMGFLRKIEGGQGLLDSFITNPRAPAELRNQALDIITQKLLDKAQKLNINQILAFSVDENTIMRGQRFGFITCPHAVIALNLKK